MTPKFMEQARKSTRDAFLVVAGLWLLCALFVLFNPYNLDLLRYWDWRASELRMFMANEMIFLGGALAFGSCAYRLSRHRRAAIDVSLLLSAAMALMFFAGPHRMNLGFSFLFGLMVMTLPFAVYLEIGYWAGLASNWSPKA